MDAGHAPADITLNEAIQQKIDVPLSAGDSGTAPRSLQDSNISHMRALFQVELEEARCGFEKRLAEMYQRKLDDMKNQLLVMQRDLPNHQHSANAVKSDCEMSQQLAAVQTAYRDQTNELSRLRDEYATYKQQTEQRIQEMSATIRDSCARYQQVIEEKEQLAKLCTNISAGIKACDALKKGEEDRGGDVTPQRPSDPNSSGHKRKRPDVGSSKLPGLSSRVNSVARSPSLHSGTTRTASVKPSRFSPRIRRQGLDAGKDIRTENTGKKEIRNAKLAKNTQQRGNYLYYCGICQEQVGGVGRRDSAVDHMLGFQRKDGAKLRTRGPCAQWRHGTINPQDRQDYLLGKYPRRGVRYVKYKNGLEGEVAEEGFKDWTKEMHNQRGVIITDRDKADAAADG